MPFGTVNNGTIKHLKRPFLIVSVTVLNFNALTYNGNTVVKGY